MIDLHDAATEKRGRHRAACQRWYARNRKTELERKKAYKANNPKKVLASARASYRRNKKKVNSKWKKKYYSNLENSRAVARNKWNGWRAKNAKKRQAKMKDNYKQRIARNPGKAKADSRRHRLKSVYGITPQQYDDLLKKQQKRCAICRCAEKRGENFAVDHCHKTGKVRGLLCRSCNLALGLVSDSTATLKSAIKYLARA